MPSCRRPSIRCPYIDKRLLTLDSSDAEPMLTAEKSGW